MSPAVAGYLYLVATVLFIVGLRRLSHPATARSGNQLAAGGMLIAVVVTLWTLEQARARNRKNRKPAPEFPDEILGGR